MKIDDVKRGSIIRDNDTTELYLVLNVEHEKNCLKCLDNEFDECSLGIDWMYCYSKVEDIDMDYFVNLVSKQEE